MYARDNIPAELVKDVKNALNITWIDEATDNRISGLIAGGTVYLDRIGGGTLDYETDGLPRTLLFEYVRYARDEALDVFENNYINLLISLQTDRRIAAHVEETQTPGA